ncbi:hypothetical protein [Asticcacaulis sp. AC460]|uniref:hypothetical protein n=1 Tax=Asticcacaulis sp. AC460 TaxID=1282360 RepID=UPI0012DD59EE|nr:hypothetical protein [Asticcacaulis sp. AC460]
MEDSDEVRRSRLETFDAALLRGLADMEAGRVVDADEVFSRLEAKYARLAIEHGERGGS